MTTTPDTQSPDRQRPRYIEQPGGVIFDAGMGTVICRVAIENLDTTTARDVATRICAAMNAGAQA